MEIHERLQTETDGHDDIDREVEALFSQWRRDREKLAARRRVEQYLEMKRLREQIGDVFDLEDL